MQDLMVHGTSVILPPRISTVRSDFSKTPAQMTWCLFILNLASMRWLQTSSLLRNPSTSISFLILILSATSRVQRDSCTHPCDIYNNHLLFTTSTLHTPLKKQFFSLPPWWGNSNTSTSLHTPCITLLHLHLCWYENNDISPEIFWDETQNLVNTLLAKFHCTPCRNSQDKKQLKLILLSS